MLSALALAVLVAPAHAAGGSCATPLHSTLARDAVRDVLRGSKTSDHPPDGPVIRFFSSPGEVGRRITVSIADRRWRLCALSTAPPRARLPAPARRTNGRSEMVRKFFNDPTSMRIWFARRDASADGRTCANPFVVFADEFGARGDTFAGTVLLETEGQPGQRGTVSGRWQAKPGYVTCSAAGSAASGSPWTDRDAAGEHLLYEYLCCPNTTEGGSRIAYLYAAFRKA